MPKTAKAIATYFEVICPYCNENISEPNTGTHTMWEGRGSYGPTVECDNCHESVRLPKAITGEGL